MNIAPHSSLRLSKVAMLSSHLNQNRSRFRSLTTDVNSEAPCCGHWKPRITDYLYLVSAP
jgi:hypothetical protein